MESLLLKEKEISQCLAVEILPVWKASSSAKTFPERKVSPFLESHTAFKEKKSLSLLAIFHLRILMSAMDLKDDERNKLEGNASSLTH